MEEYHCTDCDAPVEEDSPWGVCNECLEKTFNKGEDK